MQIRPRVRRPDIAATLVATVALFAASLDARAQTAEPTARAPANTPLPYPFRGDVAEFIDALVTAYGMDRGWLERSLAQGRYSDQAEKLNTPALTPPWQRNWIEYRARNVDERRIREGAAFMRTHAAALARAREKWGVPEEIVASIIGIETFYGRVTGNLRTLDVLLTLGFDYTRRSALFREELAQFLLWCREQGIDPTVSRGSFAGAMGLPQFMPSSVRRYAVDFDGDGRIDLTKSPQDAIGSVAAFLATHGWERDVPIALKARADRSMVEVLGRGIRANTRWQDVAALGASIDGTLEPATKVLLLDLATLSPSGEEGTEFRIGTANLAAILHYNRSYFYAVSVAELAEAIRARADAAPPPAPAATKPQRVSGYSFPGTG
jgi:membrane-bound lytic murein transglycosylase B